MQAAARLPGLDAMRGIAALCVLLLHVQAVYGIGPALFDKAYLAVDFFFMLSGFLMARTYGQRLDSGLSPLAFAALRFRRLWPMMLLGGLIGAPYLYEQNHDVALFSLLFFCNMLLIPVSYQQELFPLNVPAWSVMLELFANLIHALWLKRLKFGGLLLLSAAMAVVTSIAAIVFGDFDLGARPATLLPAMSRTLLSYALGMAIFMRWGPRPMIALPPAATFAAFPLLLIAGWYLAGDNWLFDLGFVIVACPLLLAGGLAMVRPSPLAQWIGNASFPLYAVHFAVLRQARLMEYDMLTAIAAVLAVTAAVTLWFNRKQIPAFSASPIARMKRENA